MANILPKEKSTEIKKLVYSKADEHGLITHGRVENGNFIDTLVNDPEVGSVLLEYMEKGKIRTYIKDGILNAYTKSRKKEILERNSPINTIQKIYSKSVKIIQTDNDVSVCLSDDSLLYIVSSGTYLKWETALRKALELIAREPNLIKNGKTPEICLQIVVLNLGITDGDKKLITDALNAINVTIMFCNA
jgi:hypothetical protein